MSPADKPPEADNLPITPKELVAWGSALGAVLIVVCGIVATFVHAQDRCDLLDQKIEHVGIAAAAGDENIRESIATLRIEREDLRKQRDVQFAAISARCDSLDHAQVEMTTNVGQVEQKLSAITQKLDDMNDLLRQVAGDRQANK